LGPAKRQSKTSSSKIATAIDTELTEPFRARNGQTTSLQHFSRHRFAKRHNKPLLEAVMTGSIGRYVVAGALGFLMYAQSACAQSGTTTAPTLRNESQLSALILNSNVGEMIRAGFRGAVEALVQVDEHGRVRDYQLVRPSGNRFVDATIAQAVREMKFLPAMRDGRPIAASITVPIVLGESVTMKSQLAIHPQEEK
jgi:TonB family protein